MNDFKLTSLGILIAGVILLAASSGWPQDKSAKGPTITHFYAAERGRYGINWRVYIEAEETDGDMTKIAAVVDQPGQGHYPTDFVVLDPQHRNHLRGFLQWNTFSSRGRALREGARISLRVSVIDRAGRESKEVLFPFTFMSGVTDQAKAPPPFDGDNIPRIGYLSIDLVNPQEAGAP